VTHNEQILEYYRQVKAKALNPSNDQAVCLRIEDDRLIVSARGPYGETYEETVERVGTGRFPKPVFTALQKS
jgi:hypothetical protein